MDIKTNSILPYHCIHCNKAYKINGFRLRHEGILINYNLHYFIYLIALYL